MFYPIEADEIVDSEFIDLYNRILRTTAGVSSWNSSLYYINPHCAVKKKDNILYYYIKSIEGHLGVLPKLSKRSYLNDPNSKFYIKFKDGKVVIKDGKLDSLLTILDIIEDRHKIVEVESLTYKPVHCNFIEEQVNNWVLNGCPDIGFDYTLHINKSTLSLANILLPDIKVNFIGFEKSFIEIINRNSKESWVITDNPYYSTVYDKGQYVKSSSSYRSGSNMSSQIITPDKVDNLNTLISKIRWHFI